MNAVADAVTETRYLQAVNELKNATEWQTSTNLHSWFENTWLAEKQVTYHRFHHYYYYIILQWMAYAAKE